jgi:muconate cycloisomerase
VEIIADQGKIKGYGEGAPRPYVTSESQESASKGVVNFVRRDSFPWELNEISQIWEFVDNLSNSKEHNSAICAIEMSLLDTLGKLQNRSTVDYFPKDFYVNKVNYGASIPLADRARILELCQLIGNMGITQLRLKMGHDFRQNSGVFETVKLMFGDNLGLRIDSNAAWDIELAYEHIPLIEAHKVKIVEQPMWPEDPHIAEFGEALQNNGAILMADESACSLNEVKKVIKEGHYKMINVRLSKCGGFRNSLKVIEYLRYHGIPFQIGCQLGESGILSAAGRALSLLCGDADYYDGSYDAFLLKENVTVEHVSFGPGGEAKPLGGPGLGVDVSAQSLERLSTDCISLTR